MVVSICMDGKDTSTGIVTYNIADGAEYRPKRQGRFR